MKRVIIILLCLVSSTVFAAGFGVSGEAPNSGGIAVSKLLAEAKSHGDMGAANTNAASATPPAAAPVTGPAAQAQADQQAVNNSLGSTGVSQQAFANTVHNMMPLSPQQIKALRSMFNASQKAASDYPGTPPRPTSSSVVVNLSPGSTPPVIRLRAGFVTSLVFLDSTGQAWPIKAYDLGDPQSFNVQWDQKGNTLMVQALSTYKPGNLAVMLQGQDTPVMVTLMPGQRAVDYRVDLRVPGMGPNANPQFSGLPQSANSALLNFLDGVAPQGAKALQAQGGPAKVWLYKGRMYVRTMLNVVSPSWLASMSSPDGTHVFELVKAPIVLASYRGKMVKLQIQGL